MRAVRNFLVCVCVCGGGGRLTPPPYPLAPTVNRPVKANFGVSTETSCFFDTVKVLKLIQDEALSNNETVQRY